MHIGNAGLIDPLLTTAEEFEASIQRPKYGLLYCNDE